MAVFADPVVGQNSAISYTPGSSFQVRRVTDNAIVFTGSVTQWNNGAVHSQSGDRAWHGDFSALTTPQLLPLRSTNDLRSYSFRIQADIYNGVLQTAGRMFFYQRSGFAKLPQYAGNWAVGADHLQEQAAQQIVGSTPQGAGTARDVSGGWWDAGDYNKYVPFTTSVIWDLLSAYEWNPIAFTDAWNIPESGNGRPDILDEVKWETDWLLKMQLPDGSVLNRVGQTSYDVGTGPTDDTQPHYYTGDHVGYGVVRRQRLTRAVFAVQRGYAATLRRSGRERLGVSNPQRDEPGRMGWTAVLSPQPMAVATQAWTVGFACSPQRSCSGSPAVTYKSLLRSQLCASSPGGGRLSSQLAGLRPFTCRRPQPRAGDLRPHARGDPTIVAGIDLQSELARLVHPPQLGGQRSLGLHVRQPLHVGSIN